MQGRASIHINASPQTVYELVSDVARMGEWSPECYKCEWMDAATGPVVGARFKGYNRRGRIKWTTEPKVLVADPGREFGFASMMGPGHGTRWTYRFEPAEGGTELIEAYEGSGMARLLMPKRATELQQGMEETLRRIKQAVEAAP